MSLDPQALLVVVTACEVMRRAIPLEHLDMTLSIESGPDSRHEEDLTSLRRRVVAGGYSSAHSCQHCGELTIVPDNTPEPLSGQISGTNAVTPVVTSREEMRQRATAGCRLWSLLSDEVDYEILTHKQEVLTAESPESIALSHNETQELESLRRRCLPKGPRFAINRPRSTSAEACVNYVKLWFHYDDLNWPAAHLPMHIRAYENGLEYTILLQFTVFESPRDLQISDNRYAYAWPVNVDPGSAQSFQLMRTWIQRCALEHRCGISDHHPSSTPTMLLNVDRADKCGSVRLVEVLPGEKKQYLALSYCWGPNAQKNILTRTTLAEFIKDGIRVDQLDATIRDAIKVTLELGYLYLWVDALCIIQDDTGSRESELVRMDDIYENASITIVAARASSVSEGFLTQRQPAGASTPEKSFKVAYKRTDQQRNVVENWVVLVPEEEGDWGKPNEPWESRAWTLQEELLSRRQIRFGAKQTSWVCYCSLEPYEDFDGWFWGDLNYARMQRLFDRQVGRLGRILQQPGLVESVDEARRDWYSLVETFSKRALSFPEDRLPAISAVSRRMARILGDEYYCGIWKSKAPWELQWRLGPGYLTPSSVGYVEKAQEANSRGTGQPSWTWASQRSGIKFPFGNVDEPSVNLHFEIVEHVAEYRSPEDIFGAVTAAQLKVRGPVTTAPFELHECHILGTRREKTRKLEQNEMRQSGRYPDGKLILRRIFLDKGKVHLDRSPNDLLADPNRDIRNNQIFLLLIGCDEGLVLLDEGGNRFSRLGVFSIWVIEPDERAYYGGDFSTGGGYAETFLEFWGGLDSIQEIVLI